jgi:hypothetical protein
MLRLQRTVLWFTLVAPLVACKGNDQPCNEYVDPGETFDVTVIGRRTFTDATAPLLLDGLPSCGLDDVHDGDQFQVTLSKTRTYGGEAGCQQFICPDDFPAPASALEDSATITALPYVCLANHTKVRLGSECELGRFVGLYHTRPATGLYAESNGGVAPAITLVRALAQREPGKCSDVSLRFPPGDTAFVCADLWDVHLSQR